jgi:predicted 3-demethylubiquinone-9 3-methyltransferase (glyoxalase superfamily)
MPCLWFAGTAREVVDFYASVLPASAIDFATALPVDTPSGPADSVDVIAFTLMGQPFMAIGGGANETFNHAVSFMIECENQTDIDRLWTALGEGGQYERCGWLKDRFGIYWQVTPKIMFEMMRNPDRERAKRVVAAMLHMTKLDIEALQIAYG